MHFLLGIDEGAAKKTTARRLMRTVVMLGMFLCCVPTIFRLDKGTNAPPPAPGAGAYLFPALFMLSFLPVALQTVLEEGVLKDAFARPVGRSDERLARKYEEHVRKTQGSTIIRGPC